MAKVANAYTTYAARGNREDLSNRIYNIDPFDTPIFNSAGRRNVTNRTFDWQTEKLPAVDGDNARQEGFELNRAPGQPTVRQKNVCQISSRDATVSGSQESSNAAGRPSEMGSQMALKSKALKRDMEVILCSAQAINYGDDSATPVPRRTRGLIHWLRTNAFVPTYGTDPDAGGPLTADSPVITLPATETDVYPAVPSGNRVEFTEDLLGVMMESAYNQGAELKLAFMGPTLKRTFSTFKGRSTTQVLVGRTEASMVVDLYASDFGRIKALPSRWLDPNTVLLIDPAYVRVAYFRSLRSIPIAKIGDAETRMILAEWGVEVGNEAAHAVFVGAKGAANLTTTAIRTQ
jgi:hypothetical protein